MPKGCNEMQDTSGVHVWLVLGKAFQALAAHAHEGLKLSQAGLGDSEFRVLEVLLHKGPLRSIRLVPRYGSRRDRSVSAVDRLEKKALVRTEKYRRPARAPGGAHGKRARAHN